MVDNDDGRTRDHDHPISSPCEPDGSGELKMSQGYIHVYYHSSQTSLLVYISGLR